MGRHLRAMLAHLAALAAALAPLAAAHAIDPGWAKGELRVDGRAIALTHAYAHQHDNEEGLLDGRELRILLADRAVPQTLLAGTHPVALLDLARKGGVRGVLLTVDPASPEAGMRGVLLMAEGNSVLPLTSFSASGAYSGVRRLRVANNRVRGEATHDSARTRPAFAFTAAFDAPHFREEPRRVRRAD